MVAELSESLASNEELFDLGPVYIHYKTWLIL